MGKLEIPNCEIIEAEAKFPLTKVDSEASKLVSSFQEFGSRSSSLDELTLSIFMIAKPQKQASHATSDFKASLRLVNSQHLRELPK